MPTLAEVLRQLWGAARLARGDVNGMQVFGDDVRSFWQSFTAAFIVLPMYLAMIWLHPELAGGIEVGGLRFWLAEAALYANSWVIFPFVMLPVTRLMGCEERYIRFICAYNWASVLQNGLYLLVFVLGAAGLVRPEGEQLLGLIAFTVVLLYTWFVTNAALKVGVLHAFGIVCLDALLSVVVQAIGYWMKVA